jgi:deoxyribose-phosphate aldolase
MDWTYEDLAAMIDYSLLTPTLTDEELDEGCRIARRYGVASVCIMPYGLRRCMELLAGSAVKPGTTIGFPHGGHSTATKVAEARQALAEGAAELDMVINIGKARSGAWDYVRADIRAVLDPAHAAGAKVKVIFENCYLDDPQKIRLCEICGELGADWVKTSTGYAPGGGTIPDLLLMRKHAPPQVGVKAAGGVPDLDTLLQVRAIGVSRVGKRSAGILDEARRRLAGGGC